MSSHSKELIVKQDKAQLGFWLYLMTDIMLFASLFAAYMILRNNTAGGVSSHDLFEPRYALIETLILLASSFTCGLALLAMRYGHKRTALTHLTVTIVLGAAFLTLELLEFNSFVADGHSWQSSAFLSGFFTLVGIHGLHIFVGLIWATAIGAYIATHGVTANALRKFSLFALFWHFLDIVWIFIFTIIYLLGVIT